MSKDLSRRDVLIASAAGLASPLAAVAAAPIPVKIADASGGLSLVMAELMKQQRFLEAFGLAPDVMGVADGSRILGGVVSGSIDVSMMSGFGQVLPAIERGAEIKIIGGGSLRPTTALFTGKPNVNSLKDLEGKVVGTGSIGALVYQLTVLMLKKAKVDVTKVRFVNIGSSADITKAVAAGTVDAGMGATAIDTARFHVRPIPGGNATVELADYTYQGAWAAGRKIATDRNVLVRCLAAYAKMYRFVQSPQGKDPFIQARRTVFPNQAQHDHELEWDFIQTYKPFAVNLTIGPERIRYMQQVNITFQIQKTMLPYERVADMSLAAEALKLLG